MNTTDHMLLSTGIEITNPTRSNLINCNYKSTWAENQKEKLTWKLKTRKANLNKFIVAILTISSAALVLYLILRLATFVRSELTGIMLGIAGAQLMILSYYFWISRFECDANLIETKIY